MPRAIPVVDVGFAQSQAANSASAQPERLAMLLDAGRRSYSSWGVHLADTRTRIWAASVVSPYAAEVAHVARAIGRPGAFLLNYSYEWGCTAGGVPDLGGMTLLRTLDWPFDGLGQALIVVRQQAAIGDYLSVTWPGFAGVLTGLAPGRFAAAINQPPLPWPGWGKPIGWIAARLLVGRCHAMPPDHLLRLAFDTARSFADAVLLIRRTPICMPAIFTLTGPEPGQAVVIERTRDAAFEPDQATAANHWVVQPRLGRPRNDTSILRRATMSALAGAACDWSLGWLRPPILQKDTRLAVMASPRTGRLLVQGWEKTGPVTETLDLDG